MPTPKAATAIIHGTSGADILGDVSTLYRFPNTTNDVSRGTFIYGYGGHDTIFAETGTGPNADRGLDFFDGGSGSDTVIYTQSNAAMVVDLAWSAQYGRAYAIGYPTDLNNWDNRVDMLASIENIFGTNYADIIYGSGVDNHLSGFDGNDDMDGRGGNDTVNGGDGHDTLRGGAGNDVVRGDAGHDVLFGGTGVDTLEGGTGNDTLYGDDQNDVLHGQDGYNKLYGGNGNDSLLIGQSGEGYGEAGNDVIVGGNAGDTLDGGSGNDVLNGLGGNDTLIAGTGDDTVDGGAGYDIGIFTDVLGATVVFNGSSSGLVLGAASTDTFQGLEEFRLGSGSDSFLGNTSANIARLGGGNDYAYGNDGNDLFFGDGGNDTLYGQDGNDTLFGGTSNDNLHGGEGNDILRGEENNDQLFGGEGDDILDGGIGYDTLDGGSGNDVLYGVSTDTLIGGEGDDTFHLGAMAQEVHWYAGHTGHDTINGFSLAQDELVFTRGFFAGGLAPIDIEDHLMVFQSGSNAVLAANTASNGWDVIATFNNLSAYALGQGIEDGTVVTLVGVDFLG